MNLSDKVWELVLEYIDYRRHPEKSDYKLELGDIADEIKELAAIIEDDLDQKADNERNSRRGE